MIDLLLIALITVFIIDLSGFVPEVSKVVWKWIYPNVRYDGWLLPKPFSCSLCVTWWSGLIYLLIAGEFTFVMVTYLALLAFLTPVISTVLLFIKDALLRLLDVLYDTINK